MASSSQNNSTQTDTVIVSFAFRKLNQLMVGAAKHALKQPSGGKHLLL